MSQNLNVLGAAAIGAGLMYYLDPDSGRRRLALLRDQLVHAGHLGSRAAAIVASDASHRLTGMFAGVFAPPDDADADDLVLAERVRAKLGRLVRHPGAIDVTANHGNILLRGPVLADEVQQLLQGVASVPGVESVVDSLDVRQVPGNVPGLQGYPDRAGDRHGIFAENWHPTTRFLVGGLGTLLATNGISRGGVLGTALTITGLGLLARGLTNVPFGRFFGITGGRRAVDIQKTINIAAPRNQVFAIWSNLEQIPRVMEHVESVQSIGPNRTVWQVRGPAGLPIRWEAITTKCIPDSEIAWKSAPGAVVGNAGDIRFQSNPNGSTRVDVKMSYMPPLGVIGHEVATLLGSDPKHDLDDDLLRLKSLLECGHATVHHHEVTPASLAA